MTRSIASPCASTFKTAFADAASRWAICSRTLASISCDTLESFVDATVKTDAVLETFVRLKGNQHELVFYDMNRYQYFAEWLKARLEDVYSFKKLAPLPIAVTILSNQGTEDENVSEYRLERGATEYVISPKHKDYFPVCSIDSFV